MKFLTKYSDSEILNEDLQYIIGKDNFRLRIKLLEEQFHFCAYTEKFITKIDSTEVEHFNPLKKGNDNYFHYYSTLRFANEQKISKFEELKDSDFFKTLFFQNSEEFHKRIEFVDDIYRAKSDLDFDAKNLINYLGFNHDYTYGVRIKHIDRLKSTIGSFSNEEKLLYFKRNKEDLSFITAIEYHLQISLTELLNN